MKEDIRDTELQQLFDGFHPEQDDGTDFMARLNRQLDAIEFIRQIQAQQKRRNRYLLLATFVGGLATGIILYLLMPTGGPVTSVAVGTQFQLLRFILENGRLFSFVLLSMLVISSLIVIISMWQDLAERKETRDISKLLKQKSAQQLPISKDV